MAPGGAVPEVLDALPKFFLGALGLGLSLYGHGFAPLDSSGKNRLPEASKALFWSGAGLTTLTLWLLLHNFLATPDAVFFYNLGKLVVALGGIVGGLLTVFLPRLATRVMVGAVLGVVFCVLADIAGFIPPATVFVAGIGFSLCTLCFARPAHEAWSAVLSTSLVGSLLVLLAADTKLGCGFYNALDQLTGGEWPDAASLSNPLLLPATAAFLVALPPVAVAVQASAFNLWQASPENTPPPPPLVTTAAAAAAGAPVGAGGASAAVPLPKREASVPTMAALEGDKGAFNYVNPLDMPPKYEQFCGPLLFRNADALMYFFGFQGDNVKGQVEHVLMLVVNLTRDINASPVDVLHAKVFANYRKWCAHLDVRPQFSGPPDPSDPGRVGGKAADLLLWFFIWGEAANLRHMPESLCFLYHKCMQSWKARSGHALEGGQRYPGHFLDNTVTPIYEVVKRASSAKKDHPEQRNYDDFNEFFWSHVALDCCYTADPRSAARAGGLRDAETPHVFVATALGAVKKSYLEKRSWFHLFLNFRRVYEFLILTFQLLAVVGFSELLVWDAAFTIQALSSVFFTANFLQVMWGCAVAWVQLPPNQPPSLDPAAASGLLLNLAARYTVLLFQCMYFTWALDRLHAPQSSSQALRNHALASGALKSPMDGDNPDDEEAHFWWWQYIWLSLLALSGYGVEAIVQLVPSWNSIVLTGGRKSAASPSSSTSASSSSSVQRNDWIAAIWHVNCPLSRSYVGKEVVEKWTNALVYQGFWATLLAFKFTFGYLFLVQPMCGPTIQLYDDLVNYPAAHEFWVTLTLIFLRWSPAFLVYCLDCSIWFALWSGVVGTYVGMDEGLGRVKSFGELRQCFMDAPLAYCSHLVAQAALPSLTRETETDRELRNRRRKSLSGQMGDLMASSPLASSKQAPSPTASFNSLAKARALPNFKSALNLSSLLNEPHSGSSSASGSGNESAAHPTETSGLLKHKKLNAEATGSREYLRSYVTEFLDSHAIKGRQWVIFASAWNEVIDSLRASDQLSHAEQAMLKFDSFQGFLKPIYLPVFQTAGLVEQATALACSTFANAPNGWQRAHGGRWGLQGGLEQMEAGRQVATALKRDVCMHEALAEAWELFAWLVGQLLGPTHAQDVTTVVDTLNMWAAVAENAPEEWAKKKRSCSKNVNKNNSGRKNGGAAAASAAEDDADASSDGSSSGASVPALFNVINFNAFPRLLSAATNVVKAVKKARDGRKNSSSSSSSKKTSATPGPQPPAAAAAAAGAPTSVSTSAVSTANSSSGASPPSPMSGESPGLPLSDVNNSGSGGSSSGNNLGGTPSSKPKMSTSRSTGSLVDLAGLNSDSKSHTKKYSLPSSKYQALRDEGVASSGSQPDEPQVDAATDALLEAVRQLFDALGSLFKPDATVAPQHKATADACRGALKMVRQYEKGFFWDIAYAASCVDALAADPMAGKIATKLVGLLSVRDVDAEPRSDEARRRLCFFANSLFMELPPAPAVPSMHSFSVMTPFYSEDVIYTKADLEHENSDGVTVLLYLQTLYKLEWDNFLERLGIRGLKLIWSPKYLMETRLWASLRAQTLSRTVLGMMHYEAALRLQAQLERCEHDELEDVLRLKFSYVVAAQVYGKMKKSQDGKAQDIEWLLHRYPNLRVAYIDERPTNRSGGAQFYSCLIKSHPDRQGSAIQHVYRVKLPGNPCLGEGKPENQNHAMIFTRGEFMQAIDMNQDGYFEEALKHRNLLDEFKPAKGDKALPLTILGFREHIFTGSVSSVANYMALQESSFVTTGQRVLNRPLCVRLHYGHPDLFDKLFCMQNGGISKASKGINLSEDVFAGYNVGVRGGSVGFKEYCQVGKGRDVGVQQIYKFEAKLAQGNAEQCLSRDVDRYANRVDFPRLLSYFFGGIGHYINSTLTVFTIIGVTYTIAFMALLNFEAVGDRAVVILGTIQIFLAGMGVLQTLPMLATLTLERGMLGALSELIRVFGSGGPFYFIFHIQTRAYYFFQTLVAGGAQYRATGRGFVTRHAHFDENWRFFASSHIYLGIEILAALGVFGVHTTTGQFWGHSWSMFVAAMSFVWTPYWFNPLAFNWVAVRNDYFQWLLWITSEGGNASHSWKSWWREEKGYMVSLRPMEKTTVLFRAAIYLGLAAGVCGEENLSTARLLRFGHFLAITGACAAVALYADWLGGCTARRSFGGRSSGYEMIGDGTSGGSYACTPRPNAFTRFIKIPATVGLFVALWQFLAADAFLAHMAVALYYFLAAVYTVGVVVGATSVAELLRWHDLLWGHIMFVPLFTLAALQLPDRIQTWLLYHNALSEGVLIETILRQAKTSQQEAVVSASSGKGDSSSGSGNKDGATSPQASASDVEEMRRMLQQQQLLIGQLQRDLKANYSAQQIAAAASATGATAAVSSGTSSSNYSGSTDENGAVSMTPVPGAAPELANATPTVSPPQRQATIGEDFVFRGAGPVG